VNLLKIYSAQVGRDASGLSSRRELFNGTRLPGDHKLPTLMQAMRGIVEDVLWEGGVLTR
jgi:hypothetical protein